MKTLLITLTTVLVGLSLQAQIITKEEVEERAEQKTEQRVDQKVDQGIDKGLDAIEGLLFGKKKKKNKKSNDQEYSQEEESSSSSSSADDAYMGAMSKLFGGGNVDVQESYDFGAYSDVEITMTDKKGKVETMSMRYLFSKEATYVGMEFKEMSSTEEMPPSFTIFDWENYQMITLIETSGQKMGVAMNLNPEEIAAASMEEMEEDDEEIKFYKTGRTKKILGYTCEEYKMESEDGEGSFWMTDETDLHIGLAMGAMSMGNTSNGKSKSQYDLPANYPEGAMLEMEYVDDKGEKMLMTTKEINTNHNQSISTAGYTFMSMGGKMGGK